MGRIPLQINTDCALPLDNIINWKNYCLIIEENDIKKMNTILLDFHSKLNETEFVDFQKQNRLFWQNY